MNKVSIYGSRRSIPGNTRHSRTSFASVDLVNILSYRLVWTVSVSRVLAPRAGVGSVVESLPRKAGESRCQIGELSLEVVIHLNSRLFPSSTRCHARCELLKSSHDHALHRQTLFADSWTLKSFIGPLRGRPSEVQNTWCRGRVQACPRCDHVKHTTGTS